MNMKILSTALLASAAASSLFLTGCVVEERHPRRAVIVRPAVVVATPVIGTEVIVKTAPPRVRTEVVIARPSPAHVWIAGAWVWSSSAWVWEKGRWELPPKPHAVWVPHRYVFRGGVHVYVHGGWRF